MRVKLWQLIVPSCWVIFIPSVVNMALALSIGSIVPPASAPAATAYSPAAISSSWFAAIMSSELLKSYRACRFASVLPSQGCFPDLCWVPLPGLCCALSPDLCRAILLNSCSAFSPTSGILSRPTSVNRSCSNSDVISAVRSRLTSRLISDVLPCPIFVILL